ncbi:hypothetical protein BaRGS_00029540 [Batillaria attramentaria]|uniref:Uncharacterized protein n=1 Tax=Batillaria attramentaria TaxID=370345 RepID=A0ABD0JVV1_9CAEN
MLKETGKEKAPPCFTPRSRARTEHRGERAVRVIMTLTSLSCGTPAPSTRPDQRTLHRRKTRKTRESTRLERISCLLSEKKEEEEFAPER